MKTFYITTPIYYVNDIPHIGHMYTSLAADILARFNRLNNNKVMFSTGTDEHGQKIEKSALLKNEDCKTFVDNMSKNFENLTPLLNLSNDVFIRTTEKKHELAVQALWNKLKENGYIYLDKYKGWYAIRDEAFYTDDEVTTTPLGKKVAPSGAEVEWKEEESYFFKLSAFQEKLLKYYDEHPNFIAPKSRYNEIYNFIKKGLKDLSISRNGFHWGIKVPKDEQHIIYVWLDALTNYISVLGYPDTSTEDFKDFWCNNSNIIHLLGKDITRFHAIYWPAFLMAADLPLPNKIFSHGWWLNEGEKISKSLGNTISPSDLINKYGLDQSRYFLFKDIHFGNDGNFSHHAMVNRINSELANEYGNLLQRTLSILNKDFAGIIQNNLNTEQEGYLNAKGGFIENIYLSCIISMNEQDITNYINKAWEIIRFGNAYIDKEAPWSKIKNTQKEQAMTVLYFILELLRKVTILLNPIMPNATTNIFKQLGLTEEDINLSKFHTPLANNHKVGKQLPIFTKYIEEKENK